MLALYTVFEFGDGPIIDDSLYGVCYTRMASFSGETMPDNVTSLTNELWIRFKIYKTKKFDFNLTIESIPPSGRPTLVHLVYGHLVSTGPIKTTSLLVHVLPNLSNTNV